MINVSRRGSMLLLKDANSTNNLIEFLTLDISTLLNITVPFDNSFFLRQIFRYILETLKKKSESGLQVAKWWEQLKAIGIFVIIITRW